MIREINSADYEQLMGLYLHLHETEVPDFLAAKPIWERVLSDGSYHIIVAEENGLLVSSCTCLIVPNLTHGLDRKSVV